jgi:hypothetical protein
MRLGHYSANILSAISSAASSCIAGMAHAQVSSVIDAVGWPRAAAAPEGPAPLES